MQALPHRLCMSNRSVLKLLNLKNEKRWETATLVPLTLRLARRKILMSIRPSSTLTSVIMFVGKSNVWEAPAALETQVEEMCQELKNDNLGRLAPFERSENDIGGLEWWTGCHCSTAGGLERAVMNAAATGANSTRISIFHSNVSQNVSSNHSWNLNLYLLFKYFVWWLEKVLPQISLPFFSLTPLSACFAKQLVSNAGEPCSESNQKQLPNQVSQNI